MPLVTEGRNDLLTNGLTSFTHISAHTGDPVGGNEVSGGSYARQAVAWDAAGSGKRITQDAEAFSIPGGNTVLFLAIQDALTVGNLEAYGGLGTSLKYGGAAVESSDDTFTSKGHGLVDTNRVHVWAAFSESLPTGLSAGVAYFVTNATTDTFTVSLTSGGSSVNITADGDCAWQQTKPETFGSDGTLSIPDGQFVVDLTAF